MLEIKGVSLTCELLWLEQVLRAFKINLTQLWCFGTAKQPSNLLLFSLSMSNLNSANSFMYIVKLYSPTFKPKLSHDLISSSHHLYYFNFLSLSLLLKKLYSFII
ncbi:hypothetical protein CR513_52999, partial [Mucuna pruriens]